MSKRKKIVEHVKTALIIVLLISAGLMLSASSYIAPRLRASQDMLTGGQTGHGTADPVQGGVSVFPLGIVVSGAEGNRCALYYSSEQLKPAFESFAAPLAEALGSASLLREITREQWQQRLLGTGVYFEFYCAQPLTLLSDLLGSAAGEAGGFSSGSLCLSCTDEGVELCLESEADGRFYSCSTGVSAAALISRTESYSANNAVFAFTNGKFSGVDQNTVIIDTDTARRTILSENAAGAVELEALMARLGINSYVIRPYTEADGTRVYVESGKTLRVDVDGEISFKGTVSDGALTDMTGAVLYAWSLTHQVLGPVCGDAELCLAGIKELEGGEYEVRFDYLVDGVVVELPGRRAAALVTVSGAEAVKLELMPRRYTLTEDMSPLLPMAQAAAIASSSGERLVSLVYMDSGASAVCVWVTD